MEDFEYRGDVRKPTQMGIDPKDQLVYLYIRSFLNAKTKLCNPGISAIQKKFGISKDKLQESIRHLKESGWIKTEPYGRGVNYIFLKNMDHYERFSNQFLENKDMSLTKKSILVALQDYMWRNTGEVGIITYSDLELSKKLNIPYSTLKRNLKELEADNLTFTLQTNTPYMQKARVFDLYKYCQAVAFELKDQKAHLQKLDAAQESTQEEVKELKDKVKHMEKLIQMFLKEKSNNKEPNELLLL